MQLALAIVATQSADEQDILYSEGMENRHVLQSWIKNQVRDVVQYEDTCGTLGAYIHNQFTKKFWARCHVEADGTMMPLPVGCGM